MKRETIIDIVAVAGMLMLAVALWQGVSIWLALGVTGGELIVIATVAALRQRPRSFHPPNPTRRGEPTDELSDHV